MHRMHFMSTDIKSPAYRRVTDGDASGLNPCEQSQCDDKDHQQHQKNLNYGGEHNGTSNFIAGELVGKLTYTLLCRSHRWIDLQNFDVGSKRCIIAPTG